MIDPSTDHRNAIADAASAAIDAYLNGREVPWQIRGAIFRAAERRRLRGLPPLRIEHEAILDQWITTSAYLQRRE